jgi:hypothetical protein
MPLPRYHAMVSLSLAALVVARSRRWRDALPILAAGVLVDLDHQVDLAVDRATGKREHLILPLHAWEWVFALLAHGSRLGRNLAGGLAGHLALDQWNAVIRHPLAYWILVRLAYRFRARWPLVDEERFRHASSWMSKSPSAWV